VRKITRREALAQLASVPAGLWLAGSGGGADQTRQPAQRGCRDVVAEPRAVVLVSIDSLRADHAGCYGYGRETTPNLDVLSGLGTRFAQAIAPSSWTIPSHMSVFTSLYPSTHGVVDVMAALPPACVTLAQALREAGYITAAFVSSKEMLGAQYGFDRGFDLYDDYTIPLFFEVEGLHPHDGVTSEKVNEVVMNWLTLHRRERFFLFAHYWDVHYNYMPPPGYARMFEDAGYRGSLSRKAPVIAIRKEMSEADLLQAKALYDGEIRYVDEHIGQLVRHLQALGVWEDTLFVVFSDHGDEFLEHGGSAHGHTLYDELLKVPLVFTGPDVPEAQTVTAQISLTDICPTVLELCGIDGSWPMQGRSLAGLVRQGSPTHSMAFSETQLDGPLLRCARNENAKYIAKQDGSFEAYDLANDPKEQSSLKTSDGPETVRLEQGLLAFVKECRELRRRGGLEQPKPAMTPEMLERLKALGYVR